jgi:hypothetical protein
MFATPIPPTSNATAPKPSSDAVKVAFAARRAASASDGFDTFTSPGFRPGSARPTRKG